MQKFLHFVIFMACLQFSHAGLWEKATNNNFIAGERKIKPQKAALMKLNDAAFRTIQTHIPKEESGSFVIMDLPTPDGSLKKYKVFERPMMEPELYAKYPMIKTYEAVSVEDPGVVGKLDYTLWGFHAMMFTHEGVYFVDPYSNQNTGYYNCYYKKDYTRENGNYSVCETKDKTTSLLNNTAPSSGVSSFTGTPNNNGAVVDIVPDGKTRTFRLALACTIEYSAAVGGATPTKASVLSAMVTSMNRVNGVYEKELAIHMNLVNKEDTIIFITSDSYTNNNGGTMLGQNQTICDNRIGSANYDIGHVFSTGGGGVAQLGVICVAGQKAQGVTGSDQPTGDGFDIDYVAHEMGHQFGANHTFNGNTGSCSGNREASVAYEVGSGTTIMAYAGICDNNNPQPHSDDYFHRASLSEIFSYISSTSCAVTTTLPYSVPTVTNYLDSFYVPYKTPFEFSASASNTDGNPLTYCWEEWDLGPAGSWNATNNTSAPIFRSFNPTSSGTRVFPRWDSLIKNKIKYLGEVLPEVARNTKFRCTVRDVHNGWGLYNGPNVNFTVKSVVTSSLFLVQSQATATTWTGTTTQTITWDVAGTTAAPISAANVDIYLSLDSARTFPYLLASNTPNDGSETVTLPDVFTNNFSARIKVKGHGNIFFDLNDGWIKINKFVPSIVASYTSSDTVVCQGSSITFTNTSTGSPDSVRWTINGGTPSTSASTTTIASTFNTAGTYSVSLTAYKSGSSSTPFSKTIVVNPTKLTSLNQSICNGDSVVVGGQSFKTTGNFLVHLSTSKGCDSSVALNLFVKQNATATVSQTICEGSSVMIGGNTYNTTGTFVAHLASANGCDSAVTLNLTVNPNKTTTINSTLCEGSTVTVGSNTYNSTGTYVVHLQTSKGCDSTVTLNLVINPNRTTALNETVCDGNGIIVGSTLYTSQGNYVVHLQTSAGCDSTVTLNLTVNPTKTTNLSPSICEGESVTVGTSTYTTTGNFTDHLQTSLGCDSTVNTNLTVNPIPSKPVINLQNDSLEVTPVASAQYQWYLNGVLQTTTNIPQYHPTQTGSYTVIVVANNCSSVVSDPFVMTGIKTKSSDVVFSIMPNPNKGTFDLTITSNKNSSYKMSMYNVTGQEMLRDDLHLHSGTNTIHYSVETIAKGMYFISLSGNDGVVTKQVIVQ